MQTFLPYADFVRSAACLDYRRLGKQRVEAWQIFSALTDSSYGWQQHPAVAMWRGYESGLLLYGIAVCVEWISRGYRDSMLGRFTEALQQADGITLPSWLGDDAFHASHRSNLLRKDAKHYAQFNWTEDPDLEYVWPVPPKAKTPEAKQKEKKKKFS